VLSYESEIWAVAKKDKYKVETAEMRSQLSVAEVYPRDQKGSTDLSKL
jgi:hypothetical protein